MAPNSGPLSTDDTNDANQEETNNIIDLSSGEGDRHRQPDVPRLRPDVSRLSHSFRLDKPTVEIVEQPVEDFRFRYSQESRTNGSIPGVHSKPNSKTYPSIRITNYIGPVEIAVSCVTKDAPYRPHPHKVVGRHNCHGGVYIIGAQITAQNNVVQFKNIGIQCVKRSDIAASLHERKQRHSRHIADPFKTDFTYDPTSNVSLGMHHVRLAIVVMLPDAIGRCCVPLRAIKSDVITDRPERLSIVQISHSWGTALGGNRIILLTDKLPNQQLRVRFSDPNTRWYAEVEPELVHKMYSMVLITPPYSNPKTQYPVNVILQLCRPATGDAVLDRHMVGNSVQFIYIPERDSLSIIDHCMFMPDTKQLAPFQRIEGSTDNCSKAKKRPRIEDKQLHCSLLPPKNCPTKEEPTTSFFKEVYSEDWDFELATPGPSTLNLGEQIDILQNADQIKNRSTIPNGSIFTNGQSSQMGYPRDIQNRQLTNAEHLSYHSPPFPAVEQNNMVSNNYWRQFATPPGPSSFSLNEEMTMRHEAYKIQAIFPNGPTILDGINSTNGQNRPISTNGQYEPISTNGQNRPISTNGQYEPISTNGQNRPISTNGQYEPISTTGQNRPISTNGQYDPISTNGQNRPISTNGQYGPDPTNGQNGCPGQIQNRHPEFLIRQVSQTEQPSPEGLPVQDITEILEQLEPEHYVAGNANSDIIDAAMESLIDSLNRLSSSDLKQIDELLTSAKAQDADDQK